MSRRRHLSDEERALWSGFVRSIKPLRSAKAAPQAIADSGQEARSKRGSKGAHRQRNPPYGTKPPPVVKSPPLAPLDRRLKQRVARGRDAIDARIDLHGMTQREAHAALLGFLRGAQAEDAKVVLVVTGKGGGKPPPDRSERGVLRRQVPLWLELPEFRHFVVGFGEAHVSHGGQGALYVRLRRAR